MMQRADQLARECEALMSAYSSGILARKASKVSAMPRMVLLFPNYRKLVDFQNSPKLRALRSRFLRASKASRSPATNSTLCVGRPIQGA